jgi:acetyltransferase-like isoleucine patch superfamily enzyme
MPNTNSLPHDWFQRPLPANVDIEASSWLYSSFAFLHYASQRDCGVRIGRSSGIYNGTFFDLDAEGEVTIGDFCAVVGAIFSGNIRVSIGNYTFIAHEVTIADHFAAVPPNGSTTRVNSPHDDILIGEGAWIGTRAVLLPGARIGEGAIVGAAAVVDVEVPPFTTAAGNPVRIFGA